MTTTKQYETGTNCITKVNKRGLHVAFCANCDNQLNHLEYGGFDYCKSKKHNCKKCDRPCTGLNKSWETGYYCRTVHGYCKKCGTYIEYYG